MHKPQSLFNVTTALHVSGVTINHLQEHKTSVTTGLSVFVGGVRHPQHWVAFSSKYCDYSEIISET